MAGSKTAGQNDCECFDETRAMRAGIFVYANERALNAKEAPGIQQSLFGVQRRFTKDGLTCILIAQCVCNYYYYYYYTSRTSIITTFKQYKNYGQSREAQNQMRKCAY